MQGPQVHRAVGTALTWSSPGPIHHRQAGPRSHSTMPHHSLLPRRPSLPHIMHLHATTPACMPTVIACWPKPCPLRRSVGMAVQLPIHHTMHDDHSFHRWQRPAEAQPTRRGNTQPASFSSHPAKLRQAPPKHPHQLHRHPQHASPQHRRSQLQQQDPCHRPREHQPHNDTR